MITVETCKSEYQKKLMISNLNEDIDDRSYWLMLEFETFDTLFDWAFNRSSPKQLFGSKEIVVKCIVSEGFPLDVRVRIKELHDTQDTTLKFLKLTPAKIHYLIMPELLMSNGEMRRISEYINKIDSLGELRIITTSPVLIGEFQDYCIRIFRH